MKLDLNLSNVTEYTVIDISIDNCVGVDASDFDNKNNVSMW